jgi:SAM-dependent methyltransferase
MSGFSADWLSSREPIDHRSRHPGPLARLREAIGACEALEVVDLGAGTGSNLRALASHLPPRQTWRLVDHDPALIAAARARLVDWADEVRDGEEGLSLTRDGRTIEVSFAQADLAGGIEEALGRAPGLVTAAALFDLGSAAWIEAVARAVAARGALFYTALTYDGVEAWEPPHPGDAAMLAAFHAHQRRDKGFGPAAGPDATDALARAFEGLGYRVETAPSPWRLAPADAGLASALAEGAAGAVRETGLVPEPDIAAWLAARRSGALCTVGHLDLVALPGG